MSDLTLVDEIDALLAMTDESLCREHAEAIRYGTPGPCQAVMVVGLDRLWCADRAAQWLLSQKSLDLPAKRLCLTHCAGRLRLRLETERLRALRAAVAL